MKRRMSAWAIWGVGFVLLCFLPLVISLAILISYKLTGNSFWVHIQSTRNLSTLPLLPIFVLMANWPLALLPIVIHRSKKNRDTEPIWLPWAILGSLLLTAVINIPFWVGTPQEMFSNAPDAGQGTGVLAALLMFVSPFSCIVGLAAGWVWSNLLNQFSHRKST